MLKITAVVVSLVVTLVALLGLGGYRLLPTHLENCFTHDTPCGKLSGEQRNP